MEKATRAAIAAIIRADSTLTHGERSRLLDTLTEPNAAPPHDRVVRRKEAAARLGLSLRGLDLLGRQGVLPKRRLPGRKRAVGVLESDLQTLISQMPKGTASPEAESSDDGEATASGPNIESPPTTRGTQGDGHE